MNYRDAKRIASDWFSEVVGDQFGEEFRQRASVGARKEGDDWFIDLDLPGERWEDNLSLASIVIAGDGRIVSQTLHEEVFDSVRERLSHPRLNDDPPMLT